MNIGAFTDRNQQPTRDEIAETIGPKLPAWQGLVDFIHNTYSADEDLKFLCGKKYGWTLRFRIGGKLLVSLYPTVRGFTVQIVLGTTAVKKARRMKLGQNGMGVIKRATPYPEGRWLFIPVTSGRDIRDIRQLLA